MAFNGGSSRTNPNIFLNNKQYFDESLLILLESQRSKLSRLQNTIEIHVANTYRIENDNMDLRYQLKQMKIKNHNLLASLAHKNEKIEDSNDLLDELDDIKQEFDESLERLRKENQKQYEELKQLKQEIERLKKKGKLTSANSSIPSSQQGFLEVKNSRKKSNRRVGGQEGHSVHKSSLKKATNIIKVKVQKIPTGAQAVYDELGILQYYATQEIDFSMKEIVTETRYYLDKEAAPLTEAIMNTYKINPVVYSNHYKAIALYLSNKGVVSHARVCEILSEISNGNCSLQPSTLVNWMTMFHDYSHDTRKAMIQMIMEENLVYVDETGWKINGDKEWVQVMASAQLVLYLMVDQRGNDKDGVIPLLMDFKGGLVHDHFKPYYKILECIHIECNAHILRYLQQGIDLDQSKACKQMKSLLEEMLHERNEYLKEDIHHFDMEKIEAYQLRYRKILDKELKAYDKLHPNITKKVEADYIKLFRRLKEYETAHLQFIFNFDIPFTNNHAERLIRSIKIRKKMSGQSKTMKGAKSTAALTSIVQTARLQNMSSLKAIEDILNKETVKFLLT